MKLLLKIETYEKCDYKRWKLFLENNFYRLWSENIIELWLKIFVNIFLMVFCGDIFIGFHFLLKDNSSEFFSGKSIDVYTIPYIERMSAHLFQVWFFRSIKHSYCSLHWMTQPIRLNIHSKEKKYKEKS